MCRIAGIVDSTENPSNVLRQVTSMCDVMEHGGPDDEGFFHNEEHGVVFGHRRLALLDLSSNGHQPMSYLEERFIITFNGEIYNYLTIKEELEKLGFVFNSGSDTEVILAGYAHWNTAIFEKLNGMFAFALFDKEKKITHLVRDHAGIKPLYYAIDHGRLTFASEVKAFKELGKPDDANWKIYFLAFGHIPEPFSTLSGVLMLPKGNYLTWDHRSCSSTIAPYQIRNHQISISEKHQAMAKVEQSLSNAVQRQLVADAPVGIFLSGGIDSSILALLANQLKGRKSLHTVSINFTDREFSEKFYQNIVLSQIETEHSSFTLDQDLFNQHFSKAIAAMDQPTADGINSWFINFYAKKIGLKAVLSGIGADEIFGGYPSFSRIRLVNFLSKFPNFLFRSSRFLTTTIGKRSYYLSYGNEVGKYLFLRGFFAPDEIASLLNVSVSEVDSVLSNLPVPQMPISLKPEEQASWYETNFYMQNQLLKDTDFMSMQHGIEVRVPFLDKEIMELMASISNEIKYPKGQKKGLLIDSFNKILPKQIWDRPKMGFTFPFQHWLLKNDHFQSGLAKPKNKQASKMIADFRKGKLHWSKAMAIYQIFADA